MLTLSIGHTLAYTEGVCPLIKLGAAVSVGRHF
jgi:hypothetical protein